MTRVPIFAQPRRRTFFSFHHGNDIWRANQIRNAWSIVASEEQKLLGFFDASIWERTKSQGDEAVKSLIRRGVENTSVTCVLAGTLTYQRRWVRYEIARSLIKGNGLITVYINSLKDNNRQLSLQGPNPLDYMGVYRDPNGSLRLAERSDGAEWRQYSDYTLAINLPAGWEQPGQYVIRLSRYAGVHDYVAENGRTLLGEWIASAAGLAGR